MAKNNIKFNPVDYRYKSVVVDASVLVKLFLKEDGSEKIYDLMEMRMLGEVSIFAPFLIVYEFLNVLSKTLRDPLLVQEFYEKFKEFGVGLIDPSGKYVDEAVSDSCENRAISYYDASYHALARDMDAVFLTADKKYYDAMKGKGRVVLFA